MAGFILLSEGLLISLSSVQFDYLTERIRSEFLQEDAECMKKIFFPHDEGGMNFISADNQSEICFRAFADAAFKAHSKAQTEDLYKDFYPAWNNLLNLIRQDPRFLFE